MSGVGLTNVYFVKETDEMQEKANNVKKKIDKLKKTTRLFVDN